MLSICIKVGTFFGKYSNSDDSKAVLRVIRLFWACENCSVCFEKINQFVGFEMLSSIVRVALLIFPYENSHKFSSVLNTWGKKHSSHMTSGSFLRLDS